MMIWHLNGIASTIINMPNVKILYLFNLGLNVFKIQRWNIGFLMMISGISMKLAFRWVLLQLRELLLEPIKLDELEQYSQTIENRLRSLSALMQLEVQFHY